MKIRDLLQIKTLGDHSDRYLLSVHPSNWPVTSNTGLGDQRGKSRDVSKVWFTIFLSDVERICQSLKGIYCTDISAIAEDIEETITDLRLKTLETVDPSIMQVPLLQM
jgi:hypothetical protein